MAEAPVPDRPNFTATRPDGFGFLAHADVLRALRKNFELPEPGGRFDNLICANFAAFRTSGSTIHGRQNNDRTEVASAIGRRQ